MDVKFPKLKEVWFQDALVDDWEYFGNVIDNAPNLTSLMIVRSYFNAPQILQRRKFKLLNVGYNKEISDLKFLLYQPDLVKFYCSCTQIRTLKPLQFCLRLKELKIADCRIDDPQELIVLKYLRKMLWCDITDNPML